MELSPSRASPPRAMPKKLPAVQKPQASERSLSLVDAGALAFKRNGVWQVPSESRSSSGSFRSTVGHQVKAPLALSMDEAEHLSIMLDNTLEVPVDPVLGSAGMASTSFEEWGSQTPQEIIQEAKALLHERFGVLDDSVLEKQKTEEPPQLDKSSLIVLPDNRVRSMEDRVSDRMRALLLHEEEVPEELKETAPAASMASRRPSDSKRKAVRNPWYIPPTDWYSEKAIQMAAKEGSEVFPYDALSEVVEDEPPPGTAIEGEGEPRRLTKQDRETLHICDAYRKHLDSHKPKLRRPHFLQNT